MSKTLSLEDIELTEDMLGFKAANVPEVSDIYTLHCPACGAPIIKDGAIERPCRHLLFLWCTLSDTTVMKPSLLHWCEGDCDDPFAFGGPGEYGQVRFSPHDYVDAGHAAEALRNRYPCAVGITVDFGLESDCKHQISVIVDMDLFSEHKRRYTSKDEAVWMD